MTCTRCQSALTQNGLCPKCLLSDDGTTEFAGLQLLEPLGQGGMGQVYKALHIQLNRVVAVKFLAPAYAQLPELKSRFTQEARALARISHPHVVGVFDAGEFEGEAYIVMEYVDGGTLAEKLPLSPQQAVAVMQSVCEALQAVHHAGLVHRDLKPANVLLTAQGEVKLSDFGIAKVLQQDNLTKTDMAFGTPGFVAPEMLRGEPASIQSDIYALGAMLRQLLTGQPPVGECPRLPGGLEAVVRRAMAETPSARYETAREFQRALSEVVIDDAFSLPPEERLWEQAVALSMTLAFAAISWALLLSLTPRVMAANELPPMGLATTPVLADGRVLSRFRFETGWVLTAAGFFCAALAAVGALRVHWRKAGLLTSRPSGALPFARHTFVTGFLSFSFYAVLVKHVIGAHAFVPLVGGVLLFSHIFVASMTRLEAWRWSRRLRKEPVWILGAALGLVPPISESLKLIFGH